MASHGEEITEALYGIVDWSWSGHGDPPATVSFNTKTEEHPLEYIDRSQRLPALFFSKTAWPSIIHHPKIVTEVYRLRIYIVDNMPASGYPETAIRQKADAVTTNILASADYTNPAYNLSGRMNLSYVEDVRYLGTFIEEEMAELINALGLSLVSVASDYEIHAYGTLR